MEGRTLDRKPVGIDAASGADVGIPRIERMLEEQEGLCAKLEEMSQEQGRLVAAGDADGALAIISDRQGVIERLSVLTTEIERLRDTGMGGMRDAQKDRARRAAERVAAMAAAIRERDRMDLAALGRQKEAVERELAGMAKGRGALAAYGAKQAGGVFQDRKG